MATTKDLQDLEDKLVRLLQDQTLKFQQELAEKADTISRQQATIDGGKQQCAALQTKLRRLASDPLSHVGEDHSPGITVEQQILQVCKRVQQPGELFEDYPWTLYEMFDSVSSPPSEATRVHHIIENSDPAIRIHIRGLKQADYNMTAIINREREARRGLGPNHPYMRSFGLSNLPAVAPATTESSQLVKFQLPAESSATFYCHHCWQPAHIARDCPDRKAGIPRRKSSLWQDSSTPNQHTDSTPDSPSPWVHHDVSLHSLELSPPNTPQPLRSPYYVPTSASLHTTYEGGLERASHAYSSSDLVPLETASTYPCTGDTPKEDSVDYDAEPQGNSVGYSSPPAGTTDPFQDSSLAHSPY